FQSRLKGKSDGGRPSLNARETLLDHDNVCSMAQELRAHVHEPRGVLRRECRGAPELSCGFGRLSDPLDGTERTRMFEVSGVTAQDGKVGWSKEENVHAGHAGHLTRVFERLLIFDLDHDKSLLIRVPDV